MRLGWAGVALAIVACACKADHQPPKATQAKEAGSAVENSLPPVLPTPGALPAPPPNSPSPKLALVTCFAAPEAPYMLAGDPDIPGTEYGYHQGAAPTTTYERQPFGLPQPPLAKPHIWASPNDDSKHVGDALNAALAPHEAELVQCFQKALADPSESQHEMTVIWDKTIEVKLRDDIKDPLLDDTSTACVQKILSTIKLPPKVRAGLEFPVVGLYASRLTSVPRPPRRERDGGFSISSGPGPGGHGTRAYKQGWSEFRSYDDGAALAPMVAATIKPALPAIESCIAKLGPTVLTGSLRGVVQIGESLSVRVAGLGDNESARCFDQLRDAKLAGKNPTPDKTSVVLCDFTWGAARPLRMMVSDFEHVVKVHATDIEYEGTRYPPADDLPRGLGSGATIVIADADAPGSFINAALAFASGINDTTVLTVQSDTGGPFLVGRATMPGFRIKPGAHIGFARAAGKIDRCDKPCEANKPCAGAWIGIGDDNVGADLVALRTEAARAGFATTVVGRRVCP